ncbi:MAG: pyridoxamine 5'-phosphate oxidase family protein [Actinomycetota bacterium]|nr:pyridoxamine 5'-phosphate oxidase family protein [Actinomycetota bacterium]
MARWSEIEEAEPDFARRVRELFDARVHKTMATLRRDGSPRISGIEVQFEDGEVWIGMMPGSVKARDVLRDPRLALHSTSEDPPPDAPDAWAGDAKLSGTAEEVTQPPDAQGHRFRVDIKEVVLTRVGTPADHLLIESWHDGRGWRAVKRH